MRQADCVYNSRYILKPGWSRDQRNRSYICRYTAAWSTRSYSQTSSHNASELTPTHPQCSTSSMDSLADEYAQRKAQSVSSKKWGIEFYSYSLQGQCFFWLMKIGWDRMILKQHCYCVLRESHSCLHWWKVWNMTCTVQVLFSYPAMENQPMLVLCTGKFPI